MIGNYYGRKVANSSTADDWAINWADADCGYGVAQVTDHMRAAGKEKGPADKAWAYQTQRAVALDYTVNIAAGLQILVEKWNTTRAAKMVVNNGDILKPENWFFALWAYNTGFYPQSGAAANNGAWGVGWANNPVNPEYPAGRPPFLNQTYADAAHPQDWPYPEKVLGFAGHPPSLLESPNVYVPGFRPVSWNAAGTTGDDNRRRVKPPVTLFCDRTNQCEPGAEHKPTAPGVDDAKAGPCAHQNAAGQYDLKCWYNQPATWKPDCTATCGIELVRFDDTYPEEADGTPYPPNCSLAGLPGGALVIDDTTAASVRPNCGRPVGNSGSFAFSFPADSTGHYPAKVDLHQLGGGFGGHFYWGHSRLSSAEGGTLKITGTWTFSAAQNRWGRLMVHLPDHHAHTQQAAYKIDTGTGSFSHTRYVNQKRRANNWVSLGAYKFTGVPRVRLDTETEDGTGDDDVAFDAVAFQPLPGKPKHVVAVLGDSYASGEGASDYYTESNIAHGTSEWNGCRRSKNAWGRKLVLPGTSEALGTKADRWDADVELGFVACSGARTYNVWDASWGNQQQAYGEGQFNEQKQARSGVLTADTTPVMLTLGGNDGAAFSLAMEDCGFIGNCANDEEFLPKYKAKADEMIVKARTVLLDIKSKAPNARIVLMGYPELLSRTVKCAGSLWYDGTEVDALAELVRYVNAEQLELVNSLRANNAMRVDHADPVAAFVGHGGCDDPEWIHKFVTGPNGDGDFHAEDPAAQACLWEMLGGACLSREAFHPKSAGTGSPGYAGVMRQRLDQIGYTG